MQFFWLGLMVVLVVLEAMTLSLTTIWGAIAALVMVLLSFLELSVSVQIIVFLCISIVLVLTTRPFVVKKLHIGKYKTNSDGMVGQTAMVIETIKGDERGSVRYGNGVIWSAMAETESDVIEAGRKCVIVRIDGNKLIVKEKVSEC